MKKIYITIAIIIILIIGGYFAFKTFYIDNLTGPGSSEYYENQINKINCNSDSNCKFVCGCGCINTDSKCDQEGKVLCNMPSGNCKCKNNGCIFIEDDWLE